MALSGMELILKNVIKMLGLDPAVIEGHIVQIGKSVQTLAANSETLRRQNQAIMSHLGIADIFSQNLTNGQDHDGDAGQRNGGAH